MGNTSSSGRGHHDDSVDFGYLTPQGIYTGPRDWNQAIVTQLIIDRKLAPFYRPLEDYEDSWDDEQIIAAMKEPQQPENTDPDSSGTRADSSSIHSSGSRTHHKRPSATSKEPPRHPEAAVYHGAVECPICFLYYPSNINHSRCCDQAICTECFVQIKRADPTTTHLVSEPASCPYCVQENFGVVYTPPPWRAGINSDGWPLPPWLDPSRGPVEPVNPAASMKRRRRSFGADSPEVVAIDQIRPDWEAKLAAVRAAVQRRANRRIVMRQVGDRLIPVGITSGRVHALPAEEGTGETGEGNGGNERGSRRSRRRNQNAELNQYLGQMGLGGQDLEELMIMEAMRLSLIDHEEQQKRQQEEEKKKRDAANAPAPGIDAEAASSSGAVSPPDSHSTSMAQTPPSSSTSTVLLSPDVASTPPSGNRSGHRASSSISRLSGDYSDSGGRGRRSPSPMPVIASAMLSATSTASAVASPPASSSPMLEAHTPLTPMSATTQLSTGETGSQLTTPIPSVSSLPNVNEPDSPNAQPISSPSSGRTAVEVPIEQDNTLLAADANRPFSERTTSFASSLVSDETTGNGETYDYLPSSPSSSASSLSQKPLLDGSPSLPIQTSGSAVNAGAASSTGLA